MDRRTGRKVDSGWAAYEESLFVKLKAYLKSHNDVVWLSEKIVDPFCHWLWRQNLWVHTLALFAVWVGVPAAVVSIIVYFHG